MVPTWNMDDLEDDTPLKRKRGSDNNDDTVNDQPKKMLKKETNQQKVQIAAKISQSISSLTSASALSSPSSLSTTSSSSSSSSLPQDETNTDYHHQIQMQLPVASSTSSNFVIVPKENDIIEAVNRIFRGVKKMPSGLGKGSTLKEIQLLVKESNDWKVVLEDLNDLVSSGKLQLQDGRYSVPDTFTVEEQNVWYDNVIQAIQALNNPQGSTLKDIKTSIVNVPKRITVNGKLNTNKYKKLKGQCIEAALKRGIECHVLAYGENNGSTCFTTCVNRFKIFIWIEQISLSMKTLQKKKSHKNQKK